MYTQHNRSSVHIDRSVNNTKAGCMQYDHDHDLAKGNEIRVQSSHASVSWLKKDEFFL